MQDWEFTARYDADKRAVSVAFFLWFSLGLLGGHRFYFRRFFTAAAMAGITACGCALMWGNHAWPPAGMVVFGHRIELPFPVFVYTNKDLFVGGAWTLLAACAWWAADAFFINTLVRRYNVQLIENLKRDFGESNLTPPQNKENPNAQV